MKQEKLRRILVELMADLQKRSAVKYGNQGASITISKLEGIGVNFKGIRNSQELQELKNILIEMGVTKNSLLYGRSTIYGDFYLDVLKEVLCKGDIG